MNNTVDIENLNVRLSELESWTRSDETLIKNKIMTLEKEFIDLQKDLIEFIAEFRIQTKKMTDAFNRLTDGKN